MQNEKEYVKEAFENNFSRFKNQAIVIYGLGKNTNEIIQAFPNYNIVGLMDEARTGEIVYGKRVLAFEDLAELQVKLLVIVARNANVKIIYRRIGEFCDKNHIMVFDINGNMLELNPNNNIDIEGKYSCISKENLLRAIDQSEVISFDIFDTIIMRDVLYPQDIFEIMEKKVSEICNKKINFARERRKAEIELYLTTNPTLEQIYQNLKSNILINDVNIALLLNLEVEIERKHLLVREEINKCYKYALERGKTVFFTSDMYLTADILYSLLTDKGIKINKEQILVSCEHGCSKSEGLFDVLKEKNPNKKILHIGDNYEADYKSALDYGLYSAFYIGSAYQMLEDSNANIALNYLKSISDRNVLGRFIAKQFNDPFLFQNTNGKIQISSEYDLGYYFLAPVIGCFMTWILNELEELNISDLLLSARDGYLIVKILDLLKKSGIKTPNYKYFYASRSVCLLAGIKTEDDILYSASLAFSGTTEALLQKRYGLELSDLHSREEGEDDLEYILRHKIAILKNAEKIRINYDGYIKMNKISKNKCYGFFDFVSSGTCQMGLNNFSGLDLVGVYFVRIFDIYKEKLKIKSMYQTKCIYENQDAIMENYFFIENILTSFEPTLIDFTEKGLPVFANENRNDKQLKSLEKIQEGILDAFSYMIKNKDDLNNLKLADIFLSLIGEKYTLMSTDYFDTNPLKDEFCNREFSFSN